MSKIFGGLGLSFIRRIISALIALFTKEEKNVNDKVDSIDKLAYKYGDYYFMVITCKLDDAIDTITYGYEILVFDYGRARFKEVDGDELGCDVIADATAIDVMDMLVEDLFTEIDEPIPTKVQLDYDVLEDIFVKDMVLEASRREEEHAYIRRYQCDCGLTMGHMYEGEACIFCGTPVIDRKSYE